jgi:hypothetical protein
MLTLESDWFALSISGRFISANELFCGEEHEGYRPSPFPPSGRRGGGGALVMWANVGSPFWAWRIEYFINCQFVRPGGEKGRARWFTKFSRADLETRNCWE